LVLVSLCVIMNYDYDYALHDFIFWDGGSTK
jgi:hypothetical protein